MQAPRSREPGREKSPWEVRAWLVLPQRLAEGVGEAGALSLGTETSLQDGRPSERITRRETLYGIVFTQNLKKSSSHRNRVERSPGPRGQGKPGDAGKRPQTFSDKMNRV